MAATASLVSAMNAKDFSFMFTPTSDACTTLGLTPTPICNPSKVYGDSALAQVNNKCHGDYQTVMSTLDQEFVATVYYEWSEIETPNSKVFGYNGIAIDMSPYFDANLDWLGAYSAELMPVFATDATVRFSRDPNLETLGNCLADIYGVGMVESQPMLCVSSQVILYLSLIIISALIIVRFALAICFDWFLSWQLGKIQETNKFSRIQAQKKNNTAHTEAALSNPATNDPLSGTGVTAATHPQSFTLFNRISFKDRYRELYTICVVTAYSEGESGLRMTMDSLAQTDYHDHYKVIFVVADGVVKGSGNPKPTGEIVLDMLELDSAMHGPVETVTEVDKDGKETKRIVARNCEPQSYVAIGAGQKRHNKARIYCGTYLSGGRKIATILVSKCGSESEQGGGKIGNRGKRDSQICLMDFLSKIMFDEPLSPMQYDLFTKMTHIMTVQNGGVKRVTPDMFEIVLMVDADTKVAPDSLTHLIAVMQRDPTVMGLCGETRIMNKNESWVTMIQVFEYHISHHLAKAFESVFGGVTCLPGCFCMYRIKSPKPLSLENRDVVNPEQVCDWVPVLANPDIVADYSESVVDTLHKKNLLLLGEDRYLTTLMLRTFPKRKMIFVPKSICKTQVPAEFKVLLSQRRRWINSTIHK